MRTISAALAQMLERDRDRGVDVFADESQPVELKPLVPLVLPPPDWHGEDRGDR
jgi:hypothetical protein